MEAMMACLGLKPMAFVRAAAADDPPREAEQEQDAEGRPELGAPPPVSNAGLGFGGTDILSPGSTLSTLSRHSLDTVDTVDTGVNRHHLDTTSTPPTLVSTSVDIRDALMLSTGVKSVNLVSMVSS